MINDDLGIEKGALGIRYLIQYILNGKLSGISKKDRNAKKWKNMFISRQKNIKKF